MQIDTCSRYHRGHAPSFLPSFLPLLHVALILILPHDGILLKEIYTPSSAVLLWPLAQLLFVAFLLPCELMERITLAWISGA